MPCSPRTRGGGSSFCGNLSETVGLWFVVCGTLTPDISEAARQTRDSRWRMLPSPRSCTSTQLARFLPANAPKRDLGHRPAACSFERTSR
eukprot:1844086-Prymnesium_polylepis.1